ncbi:MAG: OsmC family protein [Gemmatimonadota bacterium]|jgi:osmotically inducible protein OsmC
MDRSASATWTGTLKDGRGELSSGSGVLKNNRYSFDTRFEHGKGTNPEELLGAAHAGCYSMALSKLLNDQGVSVERIDTRAIVSLEEGDEGFEVSSVHLDTRVEAPGAEAHVVETAAEDAREGCVVSKLFDTEITLDATLVH